LNQKAVFRFYVTGHHQHNAFLLDLNSTGITKEDKIVRIHI
jgi:hypothetical protein